MTYFDELSNDANVVRGCAGKYSLRICWIAGRQDDYAISFINGDVFQTSFFPIYHNDGDCTVFYFRLKADQA